MKYLGINVTKFVHHLYEENYTTSMNKNKEELNKWRYSACLWIRRLSGVKKSVLLNLIYTFKGIPVKIPASHFCGYWQTDSSIYMWGQETQNSQHNWRGTNKTWKYCCLYRLLVKIKFWVYYSEIFNSFSGSQVKCRVSTMAWFLPASSTLLSLSFSHTGFLPMCPPRPKAFLPRGYILHLDQSHPKLLPGLYLFTFQVCQANCPFLPQTRSC